MAFSLRALLLGSLASSVAGQTTVFANPQHSGVPSPYPNPYQEHQNHSWYSGQPNSPWSNATDFNGNYQASFSPARGPAIPLAVRSPYLSAWMSTGNNGSLNSQSPIFWDGSAIGWEGIVTVDGVSYEWMGVGSQSLPQLPTLMPAVPLTVAYDSSYSNFTFAAGPVQLTASFFSPVIPTDLCRTSTPLSYLSVSVDSMDGATHNVSLYTDVNGAWVTQPAAPLIWSMYEDGQFVNGSNATTSADSLYTWIVQLETQYLFGEQYGQDPLRATQGVFPQWGNLTWTSSQGSAESVRFQSGFSANQRFQHVMGMQLQNIVDPNYRAYDEQEPVYAFEHQLGEITNSSAPIVFTIGYVVQPAIRLLTSAGIESLQPWWTTCHDSLFSLVDSHWSDLSNAQSLAASFEAKLKGDISAYYGNSTSAGQQNPPAYWFNGTNGEEVTGVDQFGQKYMFDSTNAYGYLEPSNGCNISSIAIPNADEAYSYYAITALATRQIMGAYALTVPSSTSTDQSKPYAFQKEISSSGNVNTVDVIFPAMPFFLWANPDFLGYVLEPLFSNQESHFYPNQYSMHDLGSSFPNATGHVEGNDEYMPVEESGNMIIMAYALYKLSNNAAYLQQHYSILQQWAKYLIDYTLIPAIQLSTDDFSGQLANQTNLAAKGIVGLAAMAEISSVVGDATSSANYSATAQDYYSQWTEFGIDPSGQHTLLAYQWRSSWGLLYNVYPARLLNLSVIPDSLYDMQCSFYPTVSQIWGVPLDNRHYWTKSDWEMWTAATCSSPQNAPTRRLFVDALAYWLNTTSSFTAFTDLYQTVHEGETPGNPTPIEFYARPVQGGLFSLLALLAAGTN